MHEYRTRRRIEFADTDMAGIVHFARFFVFMETAEHEFLRSLGTETVGEVDAEGRRIGWPRVSVACEYLAPAHYGEELDIHLRVLRKGTRSLTFGFDIRRGETAVARGKVTAACCQLPDGEKGLKAIPIPARLASLIQEAPGSTDRS